MYSFFDISMKFERLPFNKTSSLQQFLLLDHNIIRENCNHSSVQTIIISRIMILWNTLSAVVFQCEIAIRAESCRAMARLWQWRWSGCSGGEKIRQTGIQQCARGPEAGNYWAAAKQPMKYLRILGVSRQLWRMLGKNALERRTLTKMWLIIHLVSVT